MDTDGDAVRQAVQRTHVRFGPGVHATAGRAVLRRPRVPPRRPAVLHVAALHRRQTAVARFALTADH